MGSFSKGNAAGLKVVKGAVRPRSASPAVGVASAGMRPQDGVSLLLPESYAERIKQAVLLQKLSWASPIKLGDGKDIAQVQAIGGLSGDVVLMYFDAEQEAASYAPWYLSSLCVRVARKSRGNNRNRPPAIILLVSDESLIGRWTLESENCRGAGLLSDFQTGVLGDWDDTTVKERVAEWTRNLVSDKSQSSLTAPADTAAKKLVGSPAEPNQYFVFMASPGDVEEEREKIREYFDAYNSRNLQRGLIIKVLDWETLASARTGDPQQIIFEDVLQPYANNLVLMICMVRHKLGGDATRKSGTLQELEWALNKRRTILPSLEIKWFLSDDAFTVDSRLPQEQRNEKYKHYEEALEFKKKITDSNQYLYVSYEKKDFAEKLDHDLGLWLADRNRPWNARETGQTGAAPAAPAETATVKWE